MMKKPNKSLKTKIFRPFLILVLSMSILVFLAFNVSMRLYMNRLAMDEIASSREAVKAHLRNELKTVSDSEIGTRAQELILAINRSFRLSTLTTGAEMALLDAGGQVVLPRPVDLSPNMLEAVKSVDSRLMDGETNDTFSLKINRTDYLVSFGKYDDSGIRTRAQILVLMVSKEATSNLIQRTNFILILILSISSIIGLIISNRLAAEVTRPIKSVSTYARKLTKGHYEKMALLADTAEIHSLYEDLNNMGEALKTKEKMKIDFIQNISHDLRTPLMSIQGYAEGIKTDVFEDTKKAAGIIADESLRLTHLVDQLITLSKLDLPESRQEWTNLKLNQYLSLLIERHEGYATKEHKNITLKCSNNLKLFTSEIILDKILSNLLGNAIRFARTEICIEVRLIEDFLEIAIIDDGPGIPDEMKAKLFDRFEKGSKGQFGLGLSIADAASRQIDGHIKVDSSESGATFTLILPYKIS
jgi:signal transduction histidine kinase